MQSRDVRIPQFLCIGDSLTVYGERVSSEDGPGWVARLRERYIGRAQIESVAESGYNTNWGMELVEKALSMYKSPTVVFLFFGANDASLPGSFQHVSVDEYGDNIERMISLIPKNTTVFLITPPPLIEFESRTNENTRKYAQKLKKCPNAYVIDTFENMPRKEHLYTDGLHFSKEGNRILEEIIVHKIDSEFGHLSAEKLPKLFIPWTER